MRRFQSIRNATKCEERTVRYRYGTVHCRVVICHWGGKTRASGGGDLRAGEQKTSRTCSSGQFTRGPDARSFRVFRSGHVVDDDTALLANAHRGRARGHGRRVCEARSSHMMWSCPSRRFSGTFEFGGGGGGGAGPLGCCAGRAWRRGGDEKANSPSSFGQRAGLLAMSDLIADNARFAKVAAPLFPLEHKTKLAHQSGDRGDDVGTVQVDVSREKET